MTTLTINSKGFDTDVCGRNTVWLGGERCMVLGCTKSYVTVLYPGVSLARQSVATPELANLCSPL
jgi:hypothetical protein